MAVDLGILILIIYSRLIKMEPCVRKKSFDFESDAHSYGVIIAKVGTTSLQKQFSASIDNVVEDLDRTESKMHSTRMRMEMDLAM